MAWEGVERDVSRAVSLAERGHDMVGYAGGGVGVQGHGFEGEGMECGWGEDVPVVL